MYYSISLTMPPHISLFHFTIFFLLLINTTQLITICHTAKVIMRSTSKAKNQLPVLQNTTTELDHEFTKWVLFDDQYPTAIDYAKNKLMTAASRTITVDQNPRVQGFRTIQAAIDSIPMVNRVRVVINIHAGTYTEKVTIPPSKWYITIQGAGADNTIVQWGDIARNSNGTVDSATFGVSSPFFVAKNITFKNTAPVPPPGAQDMQAVALRISADAAAFVGCKFFGAQDTLYDDTGRHYYKDCYIQGTVDFICGYGRSFYQSCELHSIAPGGAVAAQHREHENEVTGFIFRNCKVTGSAPVYLGRAWGVFSRVVYAFTYMDNAVLPEGWADWNDTARHSTVFFGEYNNTGPGANFARRVKWSRQLSYGQAKPFITLDFINASQWLNIS